MYTPEEQQVQICLLKSNLEEIENELVVQRTTLPALDVENEQQYRETMNALRIARSINAEIETLKEENVRLIAKRMQLKRQCEDAMKALENAQEYRNDIINQLKDEEKDEDEIIRKYEDSLREKAERFRKAQVFYNEAEIKTEINKVEVINSELQTEVAKRQSTVEQLHSTLDSLTPDVPEDLTDILGKVLLDEKLKQLTDQREVLEKKRNSQLNTRRMKRFGNRK